MEIGEALLEYDEDHDMAEPQEPIETILEKDSHKRKPAWERELIREVERYGTPKGIHRERKRPRPYSNCVALLCDIINKEPYNYGEVEENKEWKDSMIKEYQSIMKNDVWDVVPRPEGKSIVTSKWIYKIKHVSYGSIKKYKARSVA